MFNNHKLSDLAVKEYPYPHILIEDILEASLYERLKETFPDESWFGDRENGDGRVNGADGQASRYNMSAGQHARTNFNDFIEKDENREWRILYEQVCDNDFTNQIVGLFSNYLEPYGYIASDYAPPTFDISYQTDGYVNPPHTDSVYHVAQMIIYIDTSKIEEGGNITTWHSPAGKQEVCDLYQLKENSAFIWLNSFNSVHASYPVLKGRRELIYIGFDSQLPSAWRDRPGASYLAFNPEGARSPWRIYDPNTGRYG